MIFSFRDLTCLISSLLNNPRSEFVTDFPTAATNPSNLIRICYIYKLYWTIFVNIAFLTELSTLLARFLHYGAGMDVNIPILHRFTEPFDLFQGNRGVTVIIYTQVETVGLGECTTVDMAEQRDILPGSEFLVSVLDIRRNWLVDTEIVQFVFRKRVEIYKFDIFQALYKFLVLVVIPTFIITAYPDEFLEIQVIDNILALIELTEVTAMNDSILHRDVLVPVRNHFQIHLIDIDERTTGIIQSTFLAKMCIGSEIHRTLAVKGVDCILKVL